VGLFRDDVPFPTSGDVVGAFSATSALRVNSAATRRFRSVRMDRADHCRAQEWRRPRDDHADDDEHEHHDRLAEGPFSADTPSHDFNVHGAFAPTGILRKQELTLPGDVF